MRLRAFLLGVYEFRRTYTTHFEAYQDYVAYDWGREIAHRITLRLFEQA